MFIDFNIIKIVKRAGRISDIDMAELVQEYTGLVLEMYATSAMEYFMEKEDLVIRSPQEYMEFMDKLPEKLKTTPELRKKIEEEMFEADMELIKHFRKTANPGDAAYLEVYLYSKIKEYNKKIKLAKLENSDDSKKADLKMIADLKT